MIICRLKQEFCEYRTFWGRFLMLIQDDLPAFFMQIYAESLLEAFTLFFFLFKFKYFLQRLILRENSWLNSTGKIILDVFSHGQLLEQLCVINIFARTLIFVVLFLTVKPMRRLHKFVFCMGLSSGIFQGPRTANICVGSNYNGQTMSN